MRSFVISCVACLMVITSGCERKGGSVNLGTPSVDSGAGRKAEDELAGTWLVESAVSDGKDYSFAEGDKYTYKDGRFEIDSKGTIFEGSYRLDASTAPKSIDQTLEIGLGQTRYLGRYSIEKDTLILCLAAQGAERPASLNSADGSQISLYKLKRVK